MSSSSADEAQRMKECDEIQRLERFAIANSLLSHDCVEGWEALNFLFKNLIFSLTSAVFHFQSCFKKQFMLKLSEGSL